jgi:hypothetical protein
MTNSPDNAATFHDIRLPLIVGLCLRFSASADPRRIVTPEVQAFPPIGKPRHADINIYLYPCVEWRP